MTDNKNSLLKKLLWQGKQKKLMYGAALGTCLGLFLLVLAVQFYFDINRLLFDTPSDHFVQINKKVNLFNTIGASSSFTEKELQSIENQPFVKELGLFTANDFKVGAYSDMLGFYTELFFESVPDHFIDIKPSSFRWINGQKEIPVIVSRDYLALYNFGFAPSQGLPQLSAKSIGRMVMDVRITGNGKNESFKGRVVGFSDRINSILVPIGFMEWANGRFGSGKKNAPSRIILDVDNPLAAEFQDLIKKNGYEISTGRVVGEQFIVLFRVITSIISLIGIIILILATIVFVLNFQLLIAENSLSIKRLLEIGYSPATISKVVSRRFLGLIGLVLLVVLIMVFLSRYVLINHFADQGLLLNNYLHIGTWCILLLTIFAMLGLTLPKIQRGITKMA